MFKFRSIEERQCLIEEIYNELEALLGISDKIKNIEEKSRSSIPDEKIDHSEELADGKLTLTKLSKVQEMNDNEKNIFIQKLISELEEKKQILENSRITLGDLISANSK